ASGYNPWTGMVQAWPMPFRHPGADVLGPRPGSNPHQAHYAVPAPANGPASTAPDPPQGVPAHGVWDQSALLAALANAGVPPAGSSSSEWFLDTGATSHMAGSSGNLHSLRPLPRAAPITVGNGATLPVTHQAATSFPTSTAPLHLRNILVSPDLIKNLVSVRSLTRDNNVSVEFDPFGFSIKDL